MGKAITEAENHKTPYGCVILDTKSGSYITTANLTKKKGKTAHAEMEALRKLDELLDGSTDNYIILTTAGPCPMCMSAIIWCGIS